MRVLAFVSPQCGRALDIAALLGEPVALAVAADDSVFASLSLDPAIERIRVWDEALDPSSLHAMDVEARQAAVVAQAARRLGTAVVVLTDSVTGFLGAAVAEQLNLAHVSEVVSAKRVAGGDDEQLLQVRRRGLRSVQVLCGAAQAVLSVLPPLPSETSQPPDGTEWPKPTVWSLQDVSLSAADLPMPQLRILSKSVRRHRPRLFVGADALVDRLRRDGLE